MFDESNKTKRFVLRMTVQEYEVIQKAAKTNGLTVAAYLRQAAYEKIKQTQPELVANA